MPMHTQRGDEGRERPPLNGVESSRVPEMDETTATDEYGGCEEEEGDC